MNKNDTALQEKLDKISIDFKIQLANDPDNGGRRVDVEYYRRWAKRLTPKSFWETNPPSVMIKFILLRVLCLLQIHVRVTKSEKGLTCETCGRLKKWHEYKQISTLTKDDNEKT